MSWLRKETIDEKPLWNELAKLQARLEGLQAQIDRVELAHKSLRGKIYKEKALEEPPEEKSEGINMHAGRYVG